MKDQALGKAVEELVTVATGCAAQIESWQSVTGGCINEAAALTLEDGRRYFIKHQRGLPSDLYEREAEGLLALRTPGILRVPEVIAVGGGDRAVPRFLVLEWIESGPRRPDSLSQLGANLARHHLATRQDRHGFSHDNYLGSTPQPNRWMEDGVAFWRECRFVHQFALARRAGLLSRDLEDLSARLLARLPRLLDERAGPPCLLHGDLWSGNVLYGPDGEPVFVDPAACSTYREAEIAMMLLFGGFGDGILRAYEEVWPLEEGSERRIHLFQLYHLLNHLNLFGGGYSASVRSSLERLIGR